MQQATEKKEQRKLPCALTIEEFSVRATEFAQCDDEIEKLENEADASKEAFKNTIGGVKSRRAVLRRVVISRSEDREVSCTWHADWASKSMLLRRDDTGEVVHARTMSPEEVQLSFDTTPEGRRLPEQRDEGSEQ